MIDGEFAHSDSNGGGGLITNGDTQWMTAGAGILHIETPPEHLVVSGGLFHGFQLWVNLPRALKFAPPRYQDIRGGNVALLSSADGGALIRVIAGEIAGHAGPGSTYTPIALVHATISPGASAYPALAARLQRARSTSCPATARWAPQQRPIADRPARRLRAGRHDHRHGATRRQDGRTPALDVLLLGGRPIREPVAAYGPVRDEHPGRARRGLRGLPGGPARQHPGRPRERERRNHGHPSTT